MYGTNPTSASYLAVPSDECGGSADACTDGTRYALWPNTRLLPVDKSLNGSMRLYIWISNSHLSSDLTLLNSNPTTSIYRSDFTSSNPTSSLPPTSLVNEAFWPADRIPYSPSSFVISNATAYLYGLLTTSATVALALAPLDSIEDKNGHTYSHPTFSSWNDTAPNPTDATARCPMLARTGDQGTYY